jgi:glycosyltransferase involved in cell wall biosynthesis
MMPRQLRVGIDGGSWSNARGYGRFTREIVRALGAGARHDYTLFLDRGARADALPPNVSVVRVPLRDAPSTAASADGYRRPLDLLRMSRAMARAAVDVLFFPSVYTFVPVLRRIPTIVGIHDTIPEQYPSLVFDTPRAQLFWRLKMALALRQSRLVLTVSSHARDSIVRALGVSPGRIRVTSEAPSPPFRRPAAHEISRDVFARYGFPASAPVLVYVGGIAPHKNLVRLVRAFGELTREQLLGNARLLLVGDFTSDAFLSAYPAVHEQVQQYGDRIAFAGRVDDDVLAVMLAAARALVLVSIEEGFGLPGIEAAACGTAVIATRQSALPEVLGDAAITVDPMNEEEIRAALRTVLLDPALARRLGDRAASRVRDLTWTASAARVADAFDELGGRPA